MSSHKKSHHPAAAHPVRKFQSGESSPQESALKICEVVLDGPLLSIRRHGRRGAPIQQWQIGRLRRPIHLELVPSPGSLFGRVTPLTKFLAHNFNGLTDL